MQRISMIEQRLQQALSPRKLNIVDDSEQHRGHKGAEGGAGHYTVAISAACFDGITRVAAHRKIYDVLGDMIPHEIHALKIQLLDYPAK